MTAFMEIANRIRRAARNQERLHLDYTHVMALIGSPIYQAITQLEAEEISSPWESSNSANSGSRGAPTGASGQSAGTIAPLEPAAESQLASAITMMAIRQAKRSKPLRITSRGSDAQKQLTPTLKQA